MKGNFQRKNKKDNRISRFISLVLRHNPKAAGITVDEHGWAEVEELIKGVSKKFPITMSDLERIVAQDEKQRYTFNEDRTLIRANQGHSIPVDVELEEKEPPEYLWHGTGTKSVSGIEKYGLLPMSRLFVHLSKDKETATKVGMRHGKPYIYKVKSGKMYEDGFIFYQSVNKVWLTKNVPDTYLIPDN